MIKIIIADDHKIFRDGVISILADEADIEVIGEAADGESVIDLLSRVEPDVLLLDISMGKTDGITVAGELAKKHPAVKILALSMHDEPDYIVKMSEAGAAGYLLKDAGSDELLKAVRRVADGETYYGQHASSALVKHLLNKDKRAAAKSKIPLTRREIEVLELIAAEYTNPEIAEKLFIGIRTVDTHRRNLIEKLNVKNTAGLVKYAIKHGLGEV